MERRPPVSYEVLLVPIRNPVNPVPFSPFFVRENRFPFIKLGSFQSGSCSESPMCPAGPDRPMAYGAACR